jgi:hypothetical protein
MRLSPLNRNYTHFCSSFVHHAHGQWQWLSYGRLETTMFSHLLTGIVQPIIIICPLGKILDRSDQRKH